MGVTEDTIYLITSVFAAALILIIGSYVVSMLASTAPFNTPTATVVAQNITYLDGVLAFGTVLLSCGCIILAYFLPSHPAFFFSFILTAILALIIAPVYSNAYAFIATTGVFATTFQQFPITAILIGNLPMFALILAAMIAVVSYGKRFIGGSNPMGELG